MKKFFTSKCKELLETFQIVKNKARQDCLFQAVLGIIKSRNVQLHAIAEGMQLEGSTIKKQSIIHRLEDFFREVKFDYDVLALLLFCCLNKGKIRLCVDRTEWDFGCCQVNILMFTASVGNIQVPLYWELLDNKSGNSNADDRIDLVSKIIDLVGIKRIGIVIADREFIGHKWLKYLKDKGINFCVRVPKHHLINRLDGRVQKVEDLASTRPLYLKNCLVDGVWVNVYLKKLDKKDDYLFLIGTMKNPKHLGQVYRQRWSIEVMFQSFKSRGFDLNMTHMKALYKLKKLVGLVSIAYAICINLGIHQHEKVQKIKTKNHGYKVNSFCRVGVDLIKNLVKHSVENFNKVINKFVRYLTLQKYKYEKTKNINTLLSKT